MRFDKRRKREVIPTDLPRHSYLQISFLRSC
jgi:hypothetical protein